MKTDFEIKSELDKLYLSLNCTDTFPKLAALKVSGDVIADLNMFTLFESGGKSYDNQDPGNKYLPPEPDANGLYCGTVNDITWVTWLRYYPNSTSSEFYNMTNDARMLIVSDVFNKCQFTKSKVTNCFLAYCVWASGNCVPEVDLYHAWYGCDIGNEDIPFPFILDRLVDLRLWLLSQLNNAELYYTGWSRGVLLLRNLLRQYIQIPLN